MSIMGSFFSSIAGLNSNGVAMEVIGNNIANINTTAFKNNRPEFSDVLSRASGGFEIGRGSRVSDVITMFSQGAFQTTNNVTDLALEGAGFFVVNNEKGQFYTRAGNFHIDELGYMVNPSGSRLQGFALDTKERFTGNPIDILIPAAPLQPQATGDGTMEGTGVSISANLDSGAELNPGGLAFDINDPLGTSNFTTSVTTYDTLGNSHMLSIYFRKSAESSTGNAWEYHVVVDENDAEVTPARDVICQSGELVFDEYGRMVSESVTFDGDPTNPYFNFKGGAEQNQQIGFDFGESIVEGGTGTSGTTQYSQPSSILAATQDGYGPSFLMNINIDEAGKVYGQYNNGQTRAFAQLSVVNFRNVSALSRLGGNMFSETHDSGQPLHGVANGGGNGRIFANTLELSNVDLAEEFVHMITSQRGFQANSRSISTADEMMQELVNLKR